MGGMSQLFSGIQLYPVIQRSSRLYPFGWLASLDDSSQDREYVNAFGELRVILGLPGLAL